MHKYLIILLFFVPFISFASVGEHAFSVDKNGTNQAHTAGNSDILTWSNELFDTDNEFSTSTNRFTPQKAGKYHIGGSVFCTGAAIIDCAVLVYKNGVTVHGGYFLLNGPLAVQNIDLIVDMNGSTDYLELYGYSTGGTSFGGSTIYTFFNGAYLGGLAVSNSDAIIDSQTQQNTFNGFLVFFLGMGFIVWIMKKR